MQTPAHAPTSRRTFLRSIVTAGSGATDDDRVLVVVFLRGGADTLNIVVPYGDDDYYRARPTLAISPPESGSSGAAIALDDLFAFHPKMAALVPAFREGRLGIAVAVGSDNTSGSHFEAQDQMEHGAGADSVATGGWIGRFLRASVRGPASPLTAVAIGEVVPESLRGAASASVIRSVEELRLGAPSDYTAAIAGSLASLYEADSTGLGEAGREAIDLLARVETLRRETYNPASGADYDDEDTFASGLRELARLVKARVGLRVACMDLDGWDTHFVQGASEGLQASVISRLANGLAAFDADLAPVRDRVTTLVMTEFGRRIYENSSGGTDHGRGFSLLALGGRTRGGTIHGAWPGLAAEEGPIGPGGVRVLVDYRAVLTEVLQRFGGLSDASEVFASFRPVPVGLTG